MMVRWAETATFLGTRRRSRLATAPSARLAWRGPRNWKKLAPQLALNEVRLRGVAALPKIESTTNGGADVSKRTLRSMWQAAMASVKRKRRDREADDDAVRFARGNAGNSLQAVGRAGLQRVDGAEAFARCGLA